MLNDIIKLMDKCIVQESNIMNLEKREEILWQRA